MGWTHDHSDAAREGRSGSGPGSLQRSGTRRVGESPGGRAIGIPRILRRRARWVSARLRHPRP
ncbi:MULTISPECIES: hypothetical protein [unclassified Streptomyces]|uniref:hypothetical protein n=1 Tax=unclassified Streptomyces TaxID=2593676 RepID=UPI00364C887D